MLIIINKILIYYPIVPRSIIEIKSDVACLTIFRAWFSTFRKSTTGVCIYIACAYSAGGAGYPFRMHACIYTGARARVEAPRPRGCVGACNAREMRRTTIQILLLLLREQSPVNRPPRHNVSIQVRSAVLNRSGSTLYESRKSCAGR